MYRCTIVQIHKPQDSCPPPVYSIDGSGCTMYIRTIACARRVATCAPSEFDSECYTESANKEVAPKWQRKARTPWMSVKATGAPRSV